MNNLTVSKSGSQVVVKELILVTTATEVLTVPCIGSVGDGASFMGTSASFASATAFDVTAIVNSMIICVLCSFP